MGYSTREAFSPPLARGASGFPENSGTKTFPFLTRDLLAPGPPERLAVRQGPEGQGGIQVAGLTHWDVPNLETLHQVGLPRLRRPCPFLPIGGGDPAPDQPCRSAFQMLKLGRSNRATAATRHEPAQLPLPRPGHADAARGDSTARSRHRRYHGQCLSPAESPAHPRPGLPPCRARSPL